MAISQCLIWLAFQRLQVCLTSLHLCVPTGNYVFLLVSATRLSIWAALFSNFTTPCLNLCSFTWHVCVLLLDMFVFFYLAYMCSFTWQLCALLLDIYVFFYLACMLCSFTWHVCVLLLGMYVLFYLACMYSNFAAIMLYLGNSS